MEWVTPPSQWRPERQPTGDATVEEFDPYQFALVPATAPAQTLYSLSKEGKAGAGPLVTGLTMAVCEAAEDIAKRHSGGRLPVPMVAVLDEAANVCRWRKLPDLYSHYGSRGICLMTILQSWSQGVEVWGREGMSKLWSAATVKVYGGGVSEVEFLENVSKLIGDFDLLQPQRQLRRPPGPVNEPVDEAGEDPRCRRAGRAPDRPDRRDGVRGAADARETDPVLGAALRQAIEASRQAHDPSRDAHRFDDLPHFDQPAGPVL